MVLFLETLSWKFGSSGFEYSGFSSLTSFWTLEQIAFVVITISKFKTAFLRDIRGPVLFQTCIFLLKKKKKSPAF